MRKIIGLILLIKMLPLAMWGQDNIDSVLRQVERNNTTLAALKKDAEAEKIGNTTGTYLANPELGFNYLWSDPAEPGDRRDFNIVQSFDFPTAYAHRRDIAGIRNEQADLEYLNERNKIMLETRMICIDIVYTNALIREYEIRQSRAGELADAYQVMFDSGEADILEWNKIRLTLLNHQKKLEALKINRTAYLDQLTALNGGKSVQLQLEQIPEQLLPGDFDAWFEKVILRNPYLQWIDRQVLISEYQAKLNRALSLPKASAGYMSENRTSEHLQGITVGISIPLWENKNTVKYQQVKTLAWENMSVDYRLQLYNQLKIQYEKAASLQKIVTDYKQSLDLYQNTDLLKKAFELGEISLLTYLTELTLTYSTIDEYLLAEYELNKALALLNRHLD